MELPSLPHRLYWALRHMSAAGGKPPASRPPRPPPPAEHLLRTRSAFSVRLNLPIYKTGRTELSALTNHRDNIFTQLQTKTALWPAGGCLSYRGRWVMLPSPTPQPVPRGGTPRQIRHSPAKQEFPPRLCWHADPFHLRLICRAGSGHGRERVFVYHPGTGLPAGTQSLSPAACSSPQLSPNQEPPGTWGGCTATEAPGVN